MNVVMLIACIVHYMHGDRRLTKIRIDFVPGRSKSTRKLTSVGSCNSIAANETVNVLLAMIRKTAHVFAALVRSLTAQLDDGNSVEQNALEPWPRGSIGSTVNRKH